MSQSAVTQRIDKLKAIKRTVCPNSDVAKSTLKTVKKWTWSNEKS